MQKDKIVQEFQSIKINKSGENIPILIKDIQKTELYNSNGENILTVEGGYLDIGILDTMKDLFVNFIGAVVFSIIGYSTLKYSKSSKIADSLMIKPVKADEEEQIH